MNTSTVKSLFFALFIFNPFFVVKGFSSIYTNCGGNLDGTVFCVDLQSPDRLPKLQAGTTCEISSEVDITFSDDYSSMNACRTEGILLRNWRVTDACGDTIYW
ncbi:MAG: hypothetical protein AB8G86_10250 [Saprospiraceae bacterium]